jgi:chemotaxis family two-component system sensor kinase Cph1
MGIEQGQGNIDHLQLIHELEVHQAELEAQNQQLREAQQQLEESRARYADLYDFAPMAYCTLDPSGCVTEINLTGAAMLGVQRGRVIGKPFAVYVAESDRGAFRSHLHHRLSSPQGPAVLELKLESAAKQPVVVEMVSAVARDANGTIVGCRSSFTDISERVRAEEALHLAVHMREEFLAIVSHDLRNPLNSVLLGSELLQASTLDVTSRSKVDLIHTAATRMSRMLSDLLDLSSMDAGHLSMERHGESVAALLVTAVEAASSGALQRTVHLHTVLSDPDMIVFCDRHRILQVLTNLIGNAMKFSSRNGTVRIEARRHDDQIEFSVRDDGIGIAKEQLDHIFDPYWQAPATAKLGTGLGLSIARGIIEFHDGQIWVESILDRGSCFFFTLPIAQPATARQRKKSGPLSGSQPIVKQLVTEPSTERGPVLIVDDEPEVHLLLADLLQREGYAVAAALDGAAALTYLQTADVLPCLILLDLVMPNVDGWQFIEQRSADPRLAAIPVVLISGQVATRETARSLGLAGSLEKPIGVRGLREILARIPRFKPECGHAMM